MSYEALRDIADSWGLIAMGVLFVTFVGWTFLPTARRANKRAATSIFENEDKIDG